MTNQSGNVSGKKQGSQYNGSFFSPPKNYMDTTKIKNLEEPFLDKNKLSKLWSESCPPNIAKDQPATATWKVRLGKPLPGNDPNK